MESSWKNKKLGELTSYISKGIPPKYVEEESDETIRVLNQKCNRSYKISYSESRLHDSSKKKVPNEKILRKGDVLINSTGTGTAGRVAQLWDASIPTTFDGHMILLRPTTEIDIMYYGYAVKSFQRKIESLAEGSTGQTEINRQRLLDEIEICYPESLQEQQRIGRLLYNIDKKIEINSGINENLYNQMLAIFNNARDTSSWSRRKLGDVLTFFDNQRKPLSSIQREKMVHVYPYYGATSIVDYVEDYLFEGTYILVSEDGANVVDSSGHPLTQYTHGKFWVNNHAHVVKGTNGYSEALVYALLGTLNMQSIVTGAAQPKINQANLRNFEAVLPESHEAQVLSDILNPMLQQMILNDQENKTLSTLRDLLLTQLMSGALDISDIEL